MFYKAACLACSATISVVLASKPSEEFICLTVLVGLIVVSFLLWSISKEKETTKKGSRLDE